MMSFDERIILGAMEKDADDELTQLGNASAKIDRAIIEKKEDLLSVWSIIVMIIMTVVWAAIYLFVLGFGYSFYNSEVSWKYDGLFYICLACAGGFSLLLLVGRLLEVVTSLVTSSKIRKVRKELKIFDSELSKNRSSFSTIHDSIEAGGYKKRIERVAPVSVNEVNQIQKRLDKINMHAGIDPERFKAAMFYLSSVAITAFAACCMEDIASDGVTDALETYFSSVSDKVGFVFWCILAVLAVLGQLFVCMMAETAGEVTALTMFATLAGPIIFALLTLIIVIVIYLTGILLALAVGALILSCSCGG